MIDTEEEMAGPFIIDSCIWIEHMTDGPKAKDCARFMGEDGEHDLITPTIVMYEVFKHIRRLLGQKEASEAIVHLQEKSTTIDLNATTAVSAAQLSTDENLHMADAIILATARRYKAKVVTSDEDLKGKDGVVYV